MKKNGNVLLHLRRINWNTKDDRSVNKYISDKEYILKWITVSWRMKFLKISYVTWFVVFLFYFFSHILIIFRHLVFSTEFSCFLANFGNCLVRIRDIDWSEIAYSPRFHHTMTETSYNNYTKWHKILSTTLVILDYLVQWLSSPIISCWIIRRERELPFFLLISDFVLQLIIVGSCRSQSVHVFLCVSLSYLPLTNK